MEQEGLVGAALAHVRICDLGGQLAGAGATKILGAFGAEVIRVEDPATHGRWDMLRAVGPYIDERRGVNLGGGFNNHNVTKRGVTLNLRTDQGRALLARLIEVSDVVTENFAAGVMQRLGFGYEQLVRIRPDIIYVSNSGFGHSGPYREFKTWGPVVQAVSGLTATSGLPDREPAGWGFSYMDHGAAAFMAVAVLAALHHREATGEGQWVDLASTLAGLTLQPVAVLDWTVNGRRTRRPDQPDGNHAEFGWMAPHNVYAASGDDRWVALACRGDADWRVLRDVIGEPWALDERFTTLAGRLAHQPEIDVAVEKWMAPLDAAQAADRLRRAGVPASIVASPQERIDQDADLASWQLFPTVHHREIGAVRVEGLPVRLSETDWSIDTAAPCLGQHNDEVLGTLLGIGAAELDRLRSDGVI
jgi:crotonobetainyl-CoA:carnitine CoA-transferase CaiB-like acyl-CoA transferase